MRRATADSEHYSAHAWDANKTVFIYSTKFFKTKYQIYIMHKVSLLKTTPKLHAAALITQYYNI